MTEQGARHSSQGQDEPTKLIRRIGRDGQIIPMEEEEYEEYEWEIEVEFTPVGENLRPSRVELRIGPFFDFPPPEGITARLLHAIKLGELVDEFNREHLGRLAAGALFFGRSAKPKYILPPPSNRPGPKGLGEDFYVDVALAYLEAVRINPRHPIVAMASFYPGHSRANVRDWVDRTRQKGYLPRPGQGRPGAEPTQKLVEAMRARGMTRDRGTTRARGKRQTKTSSRPGKATRARAKPRLT